jgi:dipeptidyl aminopeptidase/acylaminoacyl peptidase/biopolymer transport protein ExbD
LFNTMRKIKLLPIFRTINLFSLTLFVAVATICHSDGCFAQNNESLERQFISNIRQLTFEGLRAGEGYFNSHGTQLVFQSERRADNPFFQIYLLDLQSGDIEPISPGHGKTTCSWIHPKDNLVLFSSTHDDPEARAKQRSEIEFRESGQTRRYAWDYDEHFEIYAFDRQNKTYTRLTDAKGYDAEGSYSPDGSLIAFASNRSGYTEDLPEDVRKKFELDPSYLMDIYLMNSDGSDLRRLTEVPGYDGGPFFSPDGKKICWRRFSEDGKTAEIFTMNLDGSEQKQLTRLGALSWAPYFHPSGKYLIFTTNRHGFANFELYLVAADGKSMPVRVTDTDGFDGLASFSPDGKKLTWTSGRTAKKDSQIFIADWNHDAAVQALIHSAVSATSQTAQNPKSSDAQNVSAVPMDQESRRRAEETAKSNIPAIAAEDLARHVEFLAPLYLSPDTRKLSGTAVENKVLDYVATYLATLGMQPGGEDNRPFDSFQLASDLKLGPRNQLLETFVGEEGAELEINQDWLPLILGNRTTFIDSTVAFAGYGIVAPAYGSEPAYDSYEGLEVNGRWVLVLDGAPEQISEPRQRYLKRFDNLEKKAFYAQQRGAQGLFIVRGEGSINNASDRFAAFNSATIDIPVIAVSNSVAEGWLASQPQELAEIRNDLDQGKSLTGFEIQDMKLLLELDTAVEKIESRSILMRLKATAEQTASPLVLSASYDGGALSIASFLEIAEFLAGQQREGKLVLKRDVIFAIWSGSSAGQIGSSHFVDKRVKPDRQTAVANQEAQAGHQFVMGIDADGTYRINGKPASLEDLDRSLAYMGKNHPDFEVTLICHRDAKPDFVEPLIQLASQHGVNKLVIREIAEIERELVGAMIFIDSLKENDSHLVLQGTGSSPAWASAIESRNAVAGVPVSILAELLYPSDATPFEKAQIPVISATSESAFTGQSSSSNKADDRFTGAVPISQLLGLVVRGFAGSDGNFEFIPPESKIRMRARSGASASLGTMPDYAADVMGVKISGARPGTPAAKVGLQADDIIIGLAGKEIESVQEYSDVLNTLKVGEETEIVIERDGARMTLKITPVARQ